MAITDPKMGLRIWTGLPDLYDHDQLANNFSKIGYHDHSPSRGVQIPTEGLVDQAVTSAKIADFAVGTDQLADLAVTTPKINNLAVTTGKIADNAVTSPKIADDAVGSSEIADGSVGSDELATNAVTSNKILDGTIAENDLANISVTSKKHHPTAGYVYDYSTDFTLSDTWTELTNSGTSVTVDIASVIVFNMFATLGAYADRNVTPTWPADSGDDFTTAEAVIRINVSGEPLLNNRMVFTSQLAPATFSNSNSATCAVTNVFSVSAGTYDVKLEGILAGDAPIIQGNASSYGYFYWVFAGAGMGF